MEERPSRTRDRLTGLDGYAAFSARGSDDDVCETAEGLVCHGRALVSFFWLNAKDVFFNLGWRLVE